MVSAICTCWQFSSPILMTSFHCLCLQTIPYKCVNMVVKIISKRIPRQPIHVTWIVSRYPVYTWQEHAFFHDTNVNISCNTKGRISKQNTEPSSTIGILACTSSSIKNKPYAFTDIASFFFSLICRLTDITSDADFCYLINQSSNVSK